MYHPLTPNHDIVSSSLITIDSSDRYRNTGITIGLLLRVPEAGFDPSSDTCVYHYGLNVDNSPNLSE